jgi:hypothetical protein
MCEIISCDGLGIFTSFVLSFFNTTVLGFFALMLSSISFYRYWQPITMTGKRLIFIARGLNWAMFGASLLLFVYLPTLDARALLRFSLGIFVFSELLYNFSVVHLGRWGAVRGHWAMIKLARAWTENKLSRIGAGIKKWTRKQ